MKSNLKKRRKIEVLALIPARAGSRRVRNKNIRTLGGKPLIAYTIQAARKAKTIHRVIVSTDSEEIAKAAKKYGAEVPFLRPKGLAGAHSTEFEFHQHALKWLAENEGYHPDLIVNLYPTSPFRKAETIDRAVRKLLAHSTADTLRSVRKCSEHPYKMWVKGNGKQSTFLKPFVDKGSKSKSGVHTLSYHLLPEVFIQNASIYIVRPKVIQKYRSTIGKKVLAFEMDEFESVDINSPVDFKFAESLLKKSKSLSS